MPPTEKNELETIMHLLNDVKNGYVGLQNKDMVEKCNALEARLEKFLDCVYKVLREYIRMSDLTEEVSPKVSGFNNDSTQKVLALLLHLQSKRLIQQNLENLGGGSKKTIGLVLDELSNRGIVRLEKVGTSKQIELNTDHELIGPMAALAMRYGKKETIDLLTRFSAVKNNE